MSPRSSKVLVKPTILRLLIVSFFFCFGFNCYLLLKAFSLKKNLFLFAVSVCLSVCPVSQFACLFVFDCDFFKNIFQKSKAKLMLCFIFTDSDTPTYKLTHILWTLTLSQQLTYKLTKVNWVHGTEAIAYPNIYTYTATATYIRIRSKDNECSCFLMQKL